MRGGLVREDRTAALVRKRGDGLGAGAARFVDGQPGFDADLLLLGPALELLEVYRAGEPLAAP